MRNFLAAHCGGSCGATDTVHRREDGRMSATGHTACPAHRPRAGSGTIRLPFPESVIGRALTLLMAVMVPTIPFPAFRLSAGAFYIPYAAVPVALLAGWSLMSRPAHPGCSPASRGCALLLLALGGWCTLTVLAQPQPQPSHVLSLLFYLLATAAIAGTGTSSARTLYQASAALLGLVAIMVLYGLCQLAAGHSYWFEFLHHSPADLGTRNSDAFMVATLFPLALARAIVPGTRIWSRLAALGTGAAFAAAVLLSLSRSSTVGMAAAALVTLVACRRLILVRLRTAVVVAVLCLSSYLLLHGYFTHQELSLTRMSTVSESTRIPLADAAVRQGLAHPFTGIGYFGFASANPWHEDAHDAYLNLFAETGLPGVALFACLFAMPALAYLRLMEGTLWQRAGPQTRVLCLQGLGMLLSLAILSWTDTFYKSLYFWVAYILAIMHLGVLEAAAWHDRHVGAPGAGYD
jgi:O-antigen ligase